MDVGIDLKEVCMIVDDYDMIVSIINDLCQWVDYVFILGGIGLIYDDIMVDCVVVVFGVYIDVCDDVCVLLQVYYDCNGQELNEVCLCMVCILDGVDFIDNLVSIVFGFKIGNVYVMVGVLLVFQVMVVSVLLMLMGGVLLISEIQCINWGEGDIVGFFVNLVQDFDDLLIGFYLFICNGVYGLNIVI